MKEGDPAIYAERAGYDKLWHPACFTCSTCGELLVDMIYFWKNGKLYCGRHYCDSEKPRCAGCDEVCVLRGLEPLPGAARGSLSQQPTGVHQALIMQETWFLSTLRVLSKLTKDCRQPIDFNNKFRPNVTVFQISNPKKTFALVDFKTSLENLGVSVWSRKRDD